MYYVLKYTTIQKFGLSKITIKILLLYLAMVH